MRILLVGEVLRFRSFNGANKALPVLASALRNAGHSQVTQMDLERRDLSIEDVCREAVQSDLVAFAGCLTPQWPELDLDLVRVYDALRVAGRSDVPLIVGGYATKNVEDIARASPWVTAFFDGEGEQAMPDIARAVESGSIRRSTISGLCFVDEGGRFRRSMAPRVRDLDDIDQNDGFVHEPLVHDMDIFRAPDGRQLKTAQLFTQRGCPWKCGFCNKSTENNKVVRLGEEALRTQLEQLRRDGFEAIYLDVDTFTVDPEATRLEARLLHEYGFVWGSNTRIDRIDASLMEYCVEHGCVYMFFGVEHIDAAVCTAVGKFNGRLPQQFAQAAAYPSRVVRVFREMRAAGLPSSYFIILGLPKALYDDRHERIVGYRPTTFEEDMEAIRFGIERCDPDYLNLNVLRFMPGSLAADAAHHPAYSCVRPSGEAPITAGYFLPRVARARGYEVSENHPVYRLCESVGMNQPTTTALDPERVYEVVRCTMMMINARIDAGGRATRLFIERELLDAGLVHRDADGRYALAPRREWDTYDCEPTGSTPSAVETAFERAHAHAVHARS